MIKDLRNIQSAFSDGTISIKAKEVLKNPFDKKFKNEKYTD